LRTGDDIRERTLVFACDGVALCDALADRGVSARRIAAQLVAAATSVGANLEEADGAQSKPDFISKCTISLKEAREAYYWLRILRRTGKTDDDRLIDECNQIIAILTTIVRKSRGE
jgi:four helix bundle protein